MRTGTAAIALALAAFAAALLSAPGCGGGGNSERVSFAGSVSEVTLAARPEPARPVRFARFQALSDLLVPRAVAQACPSAVQDVLACAVSIDSDDLFFNCVRIDPDSCTFATQIRIPGQGIGTLAFAQDENGNGRPDDGEPGAFPADGEIPFPICNGDEILVTDAVIDFSDVAPGEEFGTWTAADVQKTADGCPATPTPTTQATATPTGGPEPTTTPEPTATATETPTGTPAP